MRRIHRSIRSSRLINAITNSGKSLSYRNARALAIILVIVLLVTSLPASAGTNPNTYGAIRRQQSFASQLYSDFSMTLASFGSWVREAVRPKRAVSRTYIPVTAYLNPAPPFISEPTNLSVISVSNSMIGLSWTPPAGGADHYQIERSESVSGPFSFIGNAGGTTCFDGSVTNLHAYLYRVRAVSAAGAISTPSNMALGTAITFEFQELDNQLIKAQHFHDVRTAINKVRALAGRPDYSWARANLAGLYIEAGDMTEMRTALNEALGDLSIPLTAYQDPTLTVGVTQIIATHLEQLQVRSTRGASTSSGPIDADTSSASLDPLNAIGGGGENPLSRNFNWTLPVVNLPGRAGMDLSLSLSYNSLVWTKSGSYIIFDRDHGSPSPGFRLGFPVIQPLYYNSEVGKNAFLLVSSDGSRTELRQVGTSALYEAANSSHLLLDTTSLASTGVMTLTTTDGTQMKYSFVSDGYQCTEVKDRNGNYITINYTNFGRIDTIIDTANRTIKFNYSGSPDNLLTSITQAWAGQQHTWATFAYEDKQVNTNFNGLTLQGAANNQWLKVLRSVTLEDNSRYEFDHSNWIQVWKIKAFGIDNHLLNYHSYDLPTTNTLQNDCPRFTERRDWVENWNRTGANGPAGVPNGAEAEVITQSWTIPASASWTLPDGTQQTGVVAQVTQPDGTYDKIYFEGLAGTGTGWRRGLIAMIETYGSSNPAQNAPIIKQRSSVRTWKHDDDLQVSYPVNPRVEETRVYDFNSSGQIQNRSRTTIAYQTVPIGDGTSCKLPNSVTEYRSDATTPLRRTSTTYLNDASYLSRRIIGLPTFTSQYEVNPSTFAETLVSKTGVTYDDSGSIIAPPIAPVQHDNTAITARGNASTIKRYDANSSAFLTSTVYYDTAGSVVKTVDPAGHQVQVSYADQFFADGVTADAARAFVVLAYPTTVTDADNFTTKTRFNYDLGAPTWAQLPQPNGASNDGPQQKFAYDSARRLQRVTNLANSAYTRYVYGPNYTEVFASINTVSDELHTISIFDGAGRTIASAQNDPSPNSAGYNGSLALIDNMGRMVKQSMAVETSVSIPGTAINPYNWSALGKDAIANNGFGWLYIARTFDWKGRPLLTTNTDGTTTNVSYDGCGCAGGEVATLTDEGTLVNGVNKTRQQKMYRDVVGRVVKTEIWDFDGTGSGGVGRQLYSTSVTTYNALNLPTLIRDFKGAAPANLDDLSCPSGDCQHTDIAYDGYGRVHTRHLPSQQATSGGTDHATWEYNADDTIHSITDARGVITTFAYNNRHLPTSISYDATAATNVAPTTNISFAYDAAGNQTSMSDGAGSVTYHYDSLSRMDWEQRTFANRPNDGPYRLSYEYNLAGLLTRVFDEHAQRGFRQTYDATARLTGLYGQLQTTETAFATQINYRASGALSSMAFNGVTLSSNYNQRGLVSSHSSVGLSRTYQYQADGQIKFVADNSLGSLPTLNRAYSYDQVGRLKDAFSGTEAINYANNVAGGTQDGPYRQTYSYDVWNNELGVNSRLWARNITTTLSAFSNDRQASWSYDNDGRLKTRNEPFQSGMALPYIPLTYKYDAAGAEVLTTQTRTYPVSQSTPIKNEFYNTSVFDGSGQLISYVNTQDVWQTLDDSLINRYVDAGYFLRSTVLGGLVISEYADNGFLLHNYVYAGTERIGDNTQFASGVPVNYWFHVDPVTGDTMRSDASGAYGRTILDPQGVDVGDTDPFPADGSGDPDGIPDQPSWMNPSPIPLPGAWADCVVDGIELNCVFVNDDNSTKCPNNDCNGRWNPNVANGRGSFGAYEFFHSFSNGYSGFMTEYGYQHYEGGSTYYRSAYEEYNEYKSHLERTIPSSFLGGLGISMTATPLVPAKTLCDHLDDKLWSLFKNHANEVGLYAPGPRRGRKVTDCYIYARNVLTYAYEQVGRRDIANAIRKIPEEAGVQLAQYLAGQGWKTYYWNPDVKNPSNGKPENPASYQTAVKTGQYYGIPVNDFVINYRKTNPAQANDTTGFAALQNVRFAYGLALGGYHNFMYSYNTVFEVHWKGAGATLYERSPFYNWGIRFGFLSGVLLTPPDCN